jgi:hypothetical protein
MSNREILPHHIIIVTIPSLGNTSDEIRCNRPYLSIGIWLYHFNFVILTNRKMHFNEHIFYYNIKS